MKTALDTQREVSESRLKLRSVAAKNNDSALTDLLESEFLHEQEDAIKQFADCITQTKRVGSGLGEYLFDKLTLNE
uniref:Ferritin n=1 Tax=Trichobilharzia regenti TaxID=157069 RepID=A0AA85K9T6_TRIRE|nr:unnamed protein product [Trichobilharzia regenti]